MLIRGIHGEDGYSLKSSQASSQGYSLVITCTVLKGALKQLEPLRTLFWGKFYTKSFTQKVS